MEVKYEQVPVGFELESVSMLVTSEMSKDFSGWPDWRNFHTDEEMAKRLGFPSLLIQGALVASPISQICTKFFGKHWFTSGKMNMKFKRPVFVPQTITAKGVLSEKEADEQGKTRLTFDVWVENEAGEKVQTGKASCLIEG